MTTKQEYDDHARYVTGAKSEDNNEKDQETKSDEKLRRWNGRQCVDKRDGTMIEKTTGTLTRVVKGGRDRHYFVVGIRAKDDGARRAVVKWTGRSFTFRVEHRK